MPGDTETHGQGTKQYHILYGKERHNKPDRRVTEWVWCDRVEISDGLIRFIGPDDVHLFGLPTDRLVRYELKKEREVTE